MTQSKEKSIGIRLLGSISAFALIISVVYMFFAGADLVSSVILASAVVGLSGPAVLTGDGLLDCAVGIVEAFVEGILGVFRGVAEALSSVFG